ncbi:MAG: translocation/assembly module TamB domain-containing protein [Chitinispirillia bacterium]|nr:translocation/assembly module TamB domain-containing protein [Chitinispirillia bacterium]MCL2268829.1 translocation/assembly module TamB domain-containing protein [Chitinispirillia bacterium]
MHVLKHRIKLAIIWPSVIILSLAVLLFALSLVSYFVISLPSVQERAVRFAEEQVQGFFSGDITIERLESNLLSYVNLHGVRAVGKSGYGDSVYVRHVRANYWIPSLLFKHIRLTSSVITDVSGHVVMAPDNQIMIPVIPAEYYDSTYLYRPSFEPLKKAVVRSEEKSRAKKTGMEKVMTWPPTHLPDPADWPVTLHLGRVRINGINAVYRDLANDMVGEIRNAQARARFHTIDSFSVVLRVPEGSYTSPWWVGDIDTIGASAVVTWTGLNVQSLVFKGAGTQVNAGGRLSYFPGGPWDLKADFITTIRPLPVLYDNFDDLGKSGFLEGTATYKGSLYEPVWAAKVKGSGVTVRGHELSSLDVDAVFGRDEYGRARIRGGVDFGRFDVTASLLMKSLMKGPEFGNYSALVLLNGIDAKKLAEAFEFDLPLAVDRGDVRLRADGQCFEAPAIIDLTAELSGEELAGGNISVKTLVRDNSWSLEGGWGDNSLSGQGSIDLATGALAGAVSGNFPDPSTATMTIFKERVTGRIAASTEFSGNFNKPEKFKLSADLKGDRIRWRGVAADSLEAHITLDEGKLNLNRADGIVSGWADSVAPVFGVASAHGYIQAELSMKGGLDAPLLNARIRGRELRYDTYALDTLAGFASFEQGMLRWNSLYLRGLGTSIYSSGRFKLPDGDGAVTEAALSAELFTERGGGGGRKPAGKVDFKGAMRSDSVTVECRISSVPLDIFDPWVPEEHHMKGVLSLTGEFSGSAANPSAKMNFKLMNPSYGDHSAYSVIGDAVLADSLVSGAAVLRAGQKSGAVELKAHMPFLPASGWKVDETGAREAFVGAQAEKFDIKDVAKYIGPDFEASGAAAFNVSLSNAGRGWDVGGMLYFPNAALRLVREEISLNGINLNASLSGTLEQPRAVFTVKTGGAEISRLRMDSCVIRGRTGLDMLVIDSARFVFRDSGTVDLRARMLYSGMDSLLYSRNFFAQYRINKIPTEVFRPFAPEFRLRRGLLNGSGTIYGSDGRPMVDGTLSLAGLEVTLPDIYPIIGPVDASVKFSGGSVELSSLNAGWGRGMIRGAGRVDWDLDGLIGVDMRVNAGGLFFELPEVVNVGVQSATLRINNQNGDLVVSGRASLGQTSYTRDFHVMDMIDQARLNREVRRAPNPFLQSVVLRIQLDLNDNMQIDMNLGTLNMGGRITVGGTAAEPGIVGEIKVRDGFVYYLDRKFQITEGTLFNPDLTAINPNLNITAKSDVVTFSPTSRAEQFTITLSMTGTLESPVIRFTSDPALSELDILSVLTFGERMGGMGSDFGNRALNLAAQQLLVGLGATRSLEKMLNVDKVSVSGDLLGAMGGGTGGGATIGLSKRFTSRLNVTYETNTVKLTDRKVTAQYRLLPNLYLEGQSTSESEHALDLIFRYSR